MLRQRADQAFLLQLCGVDLLLTALCWVFAYVVRWETGLFPVVEMVPPLWWCLRTLPLILVLSLVSYHWAGLYQLGRRWPLFLEFFRVAKATAALMVMWLTALFYLRDPYESRLASLIFWAASTTALVGIRRVYGTYFRLRRRGGYGRRALIVGTGRVARRLARALRTNNWLGVQPMGFVDDPPTSGPEPRAARTVGAIDDLPRLVDEHRIDYVFVALPLDRFGETRRVFRSLGNTLCDVRIVPDVPSFAAMNVETHELEGLPVLSLQPSRHGLAAAVFKRAMDVVLSAVGLVILAPLMSVIAVLVRMSSPGPIFYRQVRMGLNGRQFNMLKFRTMRIDAEVQTGPVWAKEGDDRRTKLGAFLRQTSLDELPQLFNVLRGDMSLVGPRPERPYFINKFRESIPHYMLRHAVKAGITGWAQVHGWRGNTSLRKRVQYDLYYIANWSPWLDLRILYLTLARAMWDKNAY